jgi:opacity protein-like surface antigen
MDSENRSLYGTLSTDQGVRMRIPLCCIIAVMAVLNSGLAPTPACANTMRIGLQIGHFSPQDWVIQERFDDGSRIPHGGYPYYRYGGFGGGIELGFGARYDFDLWGLRLDLARKAMCDDAIVHDFFSSFDWTGKMTVYSVKFFFIQRFSGGTKGISPYLGVGTGVHFAEFEVNITNRFYLGLPPTIYEGSSNPLVLSFVAGFDYSLVWKLTLDCEFEYDFAESDWKLDSSVPGLESEIRNLNIGGTTIRVGIGYGF